MGETRSNLRGVAGWLLLFVITLAAVSPMMMVYGVYTTLYRYNAAGYSFGGAWGAVQAFEWGLVAVSVAILWFAAFRLFAIQTWSTVLLTIAAIWLVGPVGVVVESIGVATIAGAPAIAVLGGTVGDFVQPIIYCTIWTSYLLLSKRVANTYPRRAPPHGVFD